LLRGDVAQARAHAGNAFALITDQGMPLLELHMSLFLAHLDILEGKGAAADADLEAILDQAREARCDLYIAAALLTQASIKLDAGNSAAVAEALREALAIGALWGYGHLFLYAAPEAESRLCAFALEADIEPCYIRRLIQARGLYPPEHAGECWPWPVRVFTLGGFRLARAGEIVRQAGKPQKRPLELLKALVAQGPAGAAGLSLAQLLWPDADNAGLKKTLDITLHRLRKLLGRDDAVLLHEGRIALNSRVCWIDLWAFEQSAARATSALRAARPDAARIERESAHALRLYAGGFLATDEESAWLLPARDRALSRFQRLVADLGRQHEQAGRWETTAELYRRGLEQDNLDEFLYRRLIFCLQRQDRHAEALGVYRRCRELLSIVLGVTPSAETEALIRPSRES
jgi:DNA-binding SARP family transcriptional activator